MVIITPSKSFVRFDSPPAGHCIWGDSQTCLPFLLDDDVAFQFIVQGSTSEEIDALCDPINSGLRIGTVRDCDDEFDVEFSDLPERYRISSLQVLYNWPHPLTGVSAFYQPGECFYIKIIIDSYPNLIGCSNCFQRIPDGCFTSVIDYSNDENFAGFNYCNSGAIDETVTCEPLVIPFTNETTLSIPYTSEKELAYGPFPTLQAWIYDGPNLVNAGVSVQIQPGPPKIIYADFGGMASGVLIIK